MLCEILREITRPLLCSSIDFQRHSEGEAGRPSRALTSASSAIYHSPMPEAREKRSRGVSDSKAPPSRESIVISYVYSRRAVARAKAEHRQACMKGIFARLSRGATAVKRRISSRPELKAACAIASLFSGDSKPLAAHGVRSGSV